jgi:hypothetical protein
MDKNFGLPVIGGIRCLSYKPADERREPPRLIVVSSDRYIESTEAGMAKPKEIVLSYQDAIGRKDFQAARKLLSDTLDFRGPLETFHQADDFLHAIQKLSAIVEGVDILKVFEEGNDVSLFCDLKTRVGTSFVAEWYKVNDGKIASMRVAFDARPFAAMFAQRATP